MLKLNSIFNNYQSLCDNYTKKFDLYKRNKTINIENENYRRP